MVRGRLEKFSRVATGIGRIVIGKELSDVLGSDGAQHGIRHGMQHGVSVTVSNGSDGVLEVNTTEDQRPTLSLRGRRFEAVQVVAVPDPEL